MIARFALAAFVVLTLALPASAAPLIVTPALRPPPGGSAQCIVANASSTKTVEYIAQIFDFDGSVQATSNPTLLPNRNLTLFASTITQAHCAVQVTSGGKKHVRVSLEILDAGGNVLAAVPGQ